MKHADQHPAAQPQKSSGILIGLLAGIALIGLILCSSLGLFNRSGSSAQNNAGQVQMNAELPSQANPAGSPATARGSASLPATAVVQILAQGKQEWSGSGTLISADGLILTNYHVAVGDRFYRVDDLIISLTLSEDAPPQPAYHAVVVQADADLDLAVLRITSDLNGKPVNRAALKLPFASLGNSDDLRLGDSISILGYPDIGGQTITLTRGEVSGFTAEAGFGSRAFIKTSATISGGNSGGLAVDSANRLIGIPTQIGSGDYEGAVVDCRRLADTNRDGVVDEQDNCVPAGGFINALRPVNLALPMINAALRGETAFVPEALPDAHLPAGTKIIAQDDFSDNAAGWPTGPQEGADTYLRNGRYFIENTQALHLVYVNGQVSVQDSIIEVEARVESSLNDGEYGVMCRHSDDAGFYFFSITHDGFYAIYRYSDGDWIALKEYTFSAFLENTQSTRFTVSCIGERLSFSVNGKLLGEVRDASLPAGEFGLFAGTFDAAANIVSFDNLLVSQP